MRQPRSSGPDVLLTGKWDKMLRNKNKKVLLGLEPRTLNTNALRAHSLPLRWLYIRYYKQNHKYVLQN